MKTDELLYEYIDELTGDETLLLDDVLLAKEGMDELLGVSSVPSREEKNIWKRQENLTLDKIRIEMKESKGENQDENIRRELHSDKSQYIVKSVSKRRLFGKRKAVVLVATFILMIGVVGFAKEHDWDIQMADMLGISEAMEDLDGGYVKVGVSDTADDVTITAFQLIGDKNCMWVQLDTNVPWTVGKNGYYLFGDDTMNCYHQPSRGLPGGITYSSYDNNGSVSFMLEFSDFNDINRATVDLWFSKLVMYEPMENGNEKETIISDGEWCLKWDNYYAANTVEKNLFKVVKLQEAGEQLTCVIREIEVSPVSIQIKGMKSPTVHTSSTFEILDSVILEDGTEIECFCTQSGISNFAVEGFVSRTDFPEIDMTQVEYIVIAGEKIKIK
ncbi:MAG: hypothetical protein J6C01_08760 [Lachnospiraceae bacterium]|nr:hypothetical protein [Lachnospiraceae bacterium]